MQMTWLLGLFVFILFEPKKQAPTREGEKRPIVDLFISSSLLLRLAVSLSSLSSNKVTIVQAYQI